MFQMMNEARIGVGLAGAATASVAYREALAYAQDRPQGRTLGTPGGVGPQVPIIEHADVRRMLLRQKAIVEGAMALVGVTARYADVALHAPESVERERAQLLLDLLTPVTKSYPAEHGFEANALAVQVHGGYGYSSEYLPEAWLRDQKLNSIHEGTTGIQGLDLLGRKVMARGGAALSALAQEVLWSVEEARKEELPSELCSAIEGATKTVGDLTMVLGAKGMSGDAAGMMLHSNDYLELASTWIVGWLWLRQATAAKRCLKRGGPHPDVYEGKLLTAKYFIETEVPRIAQLASLCASGEDSYVKMKVEWF
jgi:butyryl-CoA dehydrogenase